MSVRAAPSASGIASITGGNTQYDLARWDIPVIQAPTGTMGNNGAITLGTALPTTYANCYIVLPAGAIAAGVPAAEESFFCQMSSTTVGTVFNNTQAANTNSVGEPTIPASPTAFATTGPGAFTGVVTSRALVTINIPAGAMGTKGELDYWGDHQAISAATNKTVSVILGGSNALSVTQTTVTNINYMGRIKNRGSASSQRDSHLFSTSGATTTQSAAYLTINTANATTLVFQFQKVTATEYAVFEGGRVAIVQTT